VTLSIIIPIYNEVSYIETLVNSLLVNDGVLKEIFLVDGGSTDGTIEKIKAFQKEYSNIILVNNEKQFVSYGFNKAFPLTKGKYLTLMGAHATYPTNFFKAGIGYLENGECDVVGGPLIQKGKTSTGKTIAACMSSKFGVGGTEFRTERKKMYVDSVAFAIYKKSIFEKIGLLDEDLIRNQDDELHYRINENGYKILMVPEMECTYYVRNSISSLYKQYFQYGLYKPLVLKKVKSGIRIRHLIPALFCFYLLSLPITIILPIWIIPFILYISINLILSFKLDLPFTEKIKAPLVFTTLHISYGLGFLAGLFKL
jgi:GT2 family glycosyltransferase